MSKSKGINILWTKEEEKYLIDNYSNKSWNELLSVLSRHTKQQLIDKAHYIGIRRERVWAFQDIQLLKTNYARFTNLEDAYLFFNKKYSVKQIQKKAHSLHLIMREFLPSDYDRIINLLRSNNSEWKRQIIIQNNRQCVFTGSKDFDVHHIIPFHVLFHKALEILNIDVSKDVIIDNNMTRQICTRFYELQNQPNTGVCINKKIHSLFHNLYSFNQSTEQDWYVFQLDLLQGKYDEYLERNKLTIKR